MTVSLVKVPRPNKVCAAYLTDAGTHVRLNAYRAGTRLFRTVIMPAGTGMNELQTMADDVLRIAGLTRTGEWTNAPYHTGPAAVSGFDYRASLADVPAPAVPVSYLPADAPMPAHLTEAQLIALQGLCVRYAVTFDPDAFRRPFDLPAGWVAGSVGSIYVGCAPDGRIHT